VVEPTTTAKAFAKAREQSKVTTAPSKGRPDATEPPDTRLRKKRGPSGGPHERDREKRAGSGHRAEAALTIPWEPAMSPSRVPPANREGSQVLVRGLQKK
jgi:hypothetical protein